MIPRITKSDHEVALVLPKEPFDRLRFNDDTELTIRFDEARRRIVIEPAANEWSAVDESFARQVADFIEQYRPALLELAQQ